MCAKKKPDQKPGVRTKLNSGENKVKKLDDKNNKGAVPSTPNPTALSASKNLPTMKLATDTNWAEETSTSVLGMATPVSSERTLGNNKNVPAPKKVESIVPKEENKKKKSKKKETSADIITKQEQDLKNKYKQQKEKRPGLIDDLKTSITQGIDSIKVDYEQLAKIQTELQGSASEVSTTLKERMERIKEYANTAMANMPAPENRQEKRKKKETTYDIPKDVPKPPKKQNIKSQTTVEVQKPNESKPKAYSDESIAAVRNASEVAAEIQAGKEAKSKDQELAQAIMRRDGAQKTLSSLRAQLKYAAGDQKAALEERIKLKEAQLGEAIELIEQLNADKE